MREPAYQRRPIELLEFLELRCIDDAADDLADVVGKTEFSRNDAVDILGRQRRRNRFAAHDARRARKIQVGDDVARDFEGMRIIIGEMIGNT